MKITNETYEQLNYAEKVLEATYRSVMNDVLNSGDCDLRDMDRLMKIITDLKTFNKYGVTTENK